MKRLWDAIDVVFPDPLIHKAVTEAQKTRATTTWAAHSHTPSSVSAWTEFDNLIKEEGKKKSNLRLIQYDLEAQFQNVKTFMVKAHNEPAIIKNTSLLLTALANALNCGVIDKRKQVEFTEDVSVTKSNPDIIATSKKDGDYSDNEEDAKPAASSTPRNVATASGVGTNRPVLRSDKNKMKNSTGSVATAKHAKPSLSKILAIQYNSIFFPIEMKPEWKYKFMSRPGQGLVDLWENPGSTFLSQRTLPEEWSVEKKKVFHLVRQAYGQAVSSERKYFVIQTYFHWWFCCINGVGGGMMISRQFECTEVGPSVFQALQTLIGFTDHIQSHVTPHPSSTTKGGYDAGPQGQRQRPPKPPPGGGGASRKRSAPTTRKSNKKSTKKSTKSAESASAGLEDFASTVFMWDCDLVNVNENVRILTSRKDPSVLIKMQHYPRDTRIREEMEHEAYMYRSLALIPEVQGVIGGFRGFSTHLGVGLLCVEKEGCDFEDIGLENLSCSLKTSAMLAFELLGSFGVLHNDVELRNIVQCKEDPTKAKIIDFGRAQFSNDSELLAHQLKTAKFILDV